MKLKYIKLKHWLIAVGAAALGMNVGCERTMMCEYGTPEATYQSHCPRRNPCPRHRGIAELGSRIIKSPASRYHR